MSQLNFDLESRVDKAKQQRERQRRLRKQAKERREQKLAAAEEARQDVHKKALEKVEAEERRLREIEEEKIREMELTGGVVYTDTLEAYPLSKADTNRVVLPPSALEKLYKQKGIDQSKPMTFQLSTYGDDGNLLEQTFSGVEEFTAEEGTIGLPPKTALCLTKARGVEWLKTNPKVHVKFVILDTARKSFMRVQPRGYGFHKPGSQETVNIDIQSVLERTLQDHFVIAKGDWIPLFHAGEHYQLVVQDLQPESAIVVVNTDLDVEFLPSEMTQREMEAEKRKKQREKEFAETLAKMIQEKKAAIDQIVEPSGVGVIPLRVRLPGGGTKKSITRRFSGEDPLSVVLDWAVSNLEGLDPPAEFPDLSKLVYPVKFIQPRRVFGEKEALTQLKSLGFSTSGESLTLRWITGDVKEEPAVDMVVEESEDVDDEWNQARENVQKKVELRG